MPIFFEAVEETKGGAKSCGKLFTFIWLADRFRHTSGPQIATFTGDFG